MAALPFRAPPELRPIAQPRIISILEVNKTAYTLDPYADRLNASGFVVTVADSIDKGLQTARDLYPGVIVVYDDPQSGLDALDWIKAQHYARESWLATLPLIVLADAARMDTLRIERIPDRVIVLQRKSDSLNQLTRYVKYLTRAM